MTRETVSQVRSLPDPYSIPLDGSYNVAQRELFQTEAHWSYFERLRKEAPVHYCENSDFGPYWSVTKFNDIVSVETNHRVFSSASGFAIFDPDDAVEGRRFPTFIGMDEPDHSSRRRVVTPVVAPPNLAKLESTIRTRAATLLDALPVGEEVDWVDNISIELTTQMLATLFDFPFEERRKLTRWSDVTFASEEDGISPEERLSELMECLAAFAQLFKEKQRNPGDSDLITMLAHGEATKDLLDRPQELLGNILLLIVGGNDTTRNSITGGVVALNQNPDEYQKLRDNPDLIPRMVPEIIRWQTPLAHMRRTALENIELGGQLIKKGDKVIMWYVSGNRDADVISAPDSFIIDRPNSRHHVSFGFGIHRCMGNRLAEMRLRIVWEEILKRFDFVEMVGEPVRIPHVFVKGYSRLPVVLHPKK